MDEKIIAYLKQQAANNTTPAQVILYFLYRDGNGVEQNKQTAWQHLNAAAQSHDPLALYVRASAYFIGQGVSINRSQANTGFNQVVRLLEEKDQLTTHFADIQQFKTNTQADKEKKEKPDYPRSIKQWLFLLAQTKLRELQEQEAKLKLEELLAMVAHKFRGALSSLEYSLEYQLPATVSLKAVHEMDGLLKVFLAISADSNNLQQQLREDTQGEATFLSVLTHACGDVLKQLLTAGRKFQIIQHYLAYAIKQNLVPENTQPDDLAYNPTYHKIWKHLQKQWEQEWNELCLNAEMTTMQHWLALHFFPIHIEGFAEQQVSFNEYGQKYSLLLILFTETLVNVFKYYASDQATVVTLRLQKITQHYQFSCTNPTSQKKILKGSARGHGFLSLIAGKINAQFHVEQTQVNDSATETLDDLDAILELYDRNEAELKRTAGYQIYLELVMNLGFPKERVLFVSNHGNELQSIEAAFKTAKIRVNDQIRNKKEKTDRDAIQTWLAERCEPKTDYDILRKGVFLGCQAAQALIRDQPEKIQFCEFIKNAKPADFLADMRDYLTTLQTLLPIKEPREKSFKLFIRALTHEWEDKAEPDKAKKDRLKYTLGEIMKCARNWTTHTKEFNHLAEKDVAFLFMVAMRAMFAFSPTLQEYEKLLLKLYEYDDGLNVDNAALTQYLVKTYTSALGKYTKRLAEIQKLEPLSVEQMHFISLLKKMQWHDKENSQDYDYKQGLHEMLWHGLSPIKIENPDYRQDTGKFYFECDYQFDLYNYGQIPSDSFLYALAQALSIGSSLSQ